MKDAVMKTLRKELVETQNERQSGKGEKQNNMPSTATNPFSPQVSLA